MLMFIPMCIGIIIVIAVIISALFGHKLYDWWIKFLGIYKDENKNELKEEKEKKE